MGMRTTPHTLYSEGRLSAQIFLANISVLYIHHIQQRKNPSIDADTILFSRSTRPRNTEIVRSFFFTNDEPSEKCTA